MRLALLAATGAALVMAATAAAGSDPRVCSSVTPGGPAKHAYWCAHAAAIATVRARMAAVKHISPYAPAYCDMAGSVLKWRCTSVFGGQLWNVTVAFRATSSGWRAVTTISP